MHLLYLEAERANQTISTLLQGTLFLLKLRDITYPKTTELSASSNFLSPWLSLFNH